MAREEDPPAYLVYARDHLVETMTMSLEEAGALGKLRSHAWLNGSVIPTDPKALARICGCKPAQMARVWPAIARFFVAPEAPIGGESLVEPVLKHQRFLLDSKREKQRNLANRRWHVDANASPAHMPRQSHAPAPASSLALPLDQPVAHPSVSGAAVTEDGSEPAPSPAIKPDGRISLTWLDWAWWRVTRIRMAQGLAGVAEICEATAKSERWDLEDLTWKAMETFNRWVDSCSPGRRPGKNGYKFAEHWSVIVEILIGKRPDPSGPGAKPAPVIVAGLDFAKKGDAP